jgi:hypothetical protein
MRGGALILIAAVLGLVVVAIRADGTLGDLALGALIGITFAMLLGIFAGRSTSSSTSAPRPPVYTDRSEFTVTGYGTVSPPENIVVQLDDHRDDEVGR